jgi:3-hydroxybutyryl-CoA dehydrogenase
MNIEIKTIGIVGAGTMGQGIAISCGMAGYDTFLFDINPDLSERALEVMSQSIGQSVSKGKLTKEAGEECLNRIKIVKSLADIKADLIIEAVIENLEIKQKLFADLERINSRNAIFATNTSSISVTQIASVLQDQSRFIGLHFFNPAHLMKLVEVISGKFTSPETAIKMMHFSSSLGKTSVEVKDSPGFIVNRVARHFYVESLKLLEEEVSDVEGIDKLLRSAGFKMGPFELMDLIGIDVNFSVTTSVYEGFNCSPKFRPSAIQKEKIDQGFLGRKTGKGFYEYFAP